MVLSILPRSSFVAAARGKAAAEEVLAAVRGHGRRASPAGASGVHGFVPALTSFIGRAGVLREVAGLLVTRAWNGSWNGALHNPSATGAVSYGSCRS